MADDRLRYRVVDVFTSRAYAGNALAVVFGAEELTGPQLQAVAAEFNLSETTFVLPSDGAADYRVRIFTPSTELPFAGHPSVGTAWVLADEGRIAPGPVVQSCGAGLVPLVVAADGGPVTLSGAAAAAGEPVDPRPLLDAVGLAPDDLAGPAPREASAGLGFAYLAVRPEAVGRARPDPALVASAGGEAGLFVFARQDGQVHARVFCGAVGIAEDPATGSAALGLGAYLVASGLVAATGETRYVIAQGAEVGRPSRLECTVRAEGGVVTATTVTGSVVPVAAGEIRRPPG